MSAGIIRLSDIARHLVAFGMHENRPAYSAEHERIVGAWAYDRTPVNGANFVLQLLRIEWADGGPED